MDPALRRRTDAGSSTDIHTHVDIGAAPLGHVGRAFERNGLVAALVAADHQQLIGDE